MAPPNRTSWTWAGRLLSVPLLGLLAVSASCPPPPPTEIVRIDPTRLTTRCNSAHDSPTFSCFPAPCSHSYHEARCSFQDFIVPNLAPIEVGFEHTYSPGTQPCACWDWYTESRRAFAFFGDLRPLTGRRVVWAKLHFTEVAAGDSRQSCPASLWQVTEPPVNFSPAAVLVNDTAPSGTFVTDVVKGWAGGRDNHGFMFVSDGEGLAREPSRTCISRRGDFFLEVAVVVGS